MNFESLFGLHLKIHRLSVPPQDATQNPRQKGTSKFTLPSPLSLHTNTESTVPGEFTARRTFVPAETIQVHLFISLSARALITSSFRTSEAGARQNRHFTALICVIYSERSIYTGTLFLLPG